MDIVCILDTETTGLDPEKGAKCIEVAAVRYSLKHASIVDVVSRLLPSETNEAEAINHIPVKLLDLGTQAQIDAWNDIANVALSCDAILAHNAEFDSKWVPDRLRAHPWICTCKDVDWPKQTRRNEKLVHLAVDSGLVVNPGQSHRAIYDCLLIADLLMQTAKDGVDIVAMMERAWRTKHEYRANVRFENNHLAKNAGFMWDSKRRGWFRLMCEEDVAGLSFQVEKVGVT